MREHNVEKLPAWAQEKIKNLQRDVAYGKDQLRKRDANVLTDIVVDRYSDTPIYLAENKAIAYLFEKEEYIEFRFTRDYQGNKIGVDVYASSFGSNADLGFFPSSGNTGRLLLVKSR